jgi:D-alanine-D-alanine ligase
LGVASEETQMKVLVLAGGNSSEREVSLNSGGAIVAALNRLGHTVTAIDPANGGNLIDAKGEYAPQIADKGTSLPVQAVSSEVALVMNSDQLKSDVVFIALHGGAGENGTLQNLLQLSGHKYTGSNMTASAVAMDKAMTKRLMASVNVRTPHWRLYHMESGEIDAATVQSVKDHFKLPFIVKPNDGGSTVGLTKVERYEQIGEAFASSFKESRHVLVEEYIHGRELTVAVLDQEAFPVVEIRPKSGLYDYEAKYTKGKSEYICPAPISEDVAHGLTHAALQVYDVVGASGLARIDFLLADDGRSHCLEINTLPGMTNLSLAPMAAKAAGIDFDQLLERIIASALKRKD